MRCDLHVHTKYSFDSYADMMDYCEYALKLGLNAICFTEHYDCDPNDKDSFYFQSELYFNNIDWVRNKYDGQLTILSGAEVSEPHLYPKIMERLNNMPFDMLMGSIHIWDNYHPARISWPENSTLEDRYNVYWEQVWYAVQMGGFNCFAHLDFPKRHCGELYFQRADMLDIFSVMINKGIVPEINTSTLRDGKTEPMPGQAILEVYSASGGQYVTIGSDAHRVIDLAAKLNDGYLLSDILGLQPVLFQNKKIKVVK